MSLHSLYVMPFDNVASYLKSRPQRGSGRQMRMHQSGYVRPGVAGYGAWKTVVQRWSVLSRVLVNAWGCLRRPNGGTRYFEPRVLLRS